MSIDRLGSTGWITQPVFISSTFNDMQMERDHLRDVVFPELEKRLAPYKTFILPVDLRWGIDTLNEQNTSKKELQILKVCLEEIDRCDPYMVVILGNNYGWTPPAHHILATVSEKGLDLADHEISITHLEIEYGYLAKEKHKTNCLFYFRELGENNIDQAEDKRLISLKQKIKDSNPSYLSSYAFSNTSELFNVQKSIAAWGQRVLNDLWETLSSKLEARLETTPDGWLTIEKRGLDEFIARKTETFTGRDEFIRSVRKLIWENKKQYILITGSPGTGKSALYAQLHNLLIQEQVLLLSHSADATPASSNLAAMLKRWCIELTQCFYPEKENPQDQPEKIAELTESFASLLLLAPPETKVVLLVDALNQFERTVHAAYLTWLPSVLPKNIMFIGTITHGNELATIQNKDAHIILEIPDLSRLEGRQIIATICQKYHKQLHFEVTGKILDKVNDNKPAYINALWLSIVVEQLLLLDTDDFTSQQNLHETPEQRLHSIIIGKAIAFSPDLHQLYLNVFEQSFKRFDNLYQIDWLDPMLSFIAAGRRGWREQDLSSLMEIEQSNFQLLFALVRHYYRAHLTFKGNEMLLDFTHEQGKAVIIQKKLSDPAYYRAIHGEIVRHLASLPNGDALRQTEYLYHLIEAGQIEQATIYLSSPLSKPETYYAVNTLVSLIVTEPDNTEKKYIRLVREMYDLLQYPRFKIDEINRLNKRITSNLIHYMENESPNRERISLLEIAKENILNQTALNIQGLDPLPLIACYYRLGFLYHEFNDHKLAKQYYLAYQKQVEDLDMINKAKFAHYNHLYQNIFDKLSDLAYSDNDMRETEKYLLTGFEQKQNFFKVFRDEKNRCISYLATFERLSQLYISTGDERRGKIYAKLSVRYAKIARPLTNNYLEAGNFLIIAYRTLGDVYKGAGQSEDALTCFQHCFEIASELQELTPHNVSVANHLAVTYERFGDIYKLLDREQEALKNFQMSLMYMQSLVSRVPDASPFQETLSVAYVNVGGFYEKEDPALALSYYETAFDIQLSCLHKNIRSTRFMYRLSRTKSVIGLFYYKQENFREAQANLLRSMSFIRPLFEKEGHSIQVAMRMESSARYCFKASLALKDQANSLYAFKCAFEAALELNEIHPTDPYYLESLDELCYDSLHENIFHHTPEECKQLLLLRLDFNNQLIRIPCVHSSYVIRYICIVEQLKQLLMINEERGFIQQIMNDLSDIIAFIAQQFKTTVDCHLWMADIYTECANYFFETKLRLGNDADNYNSAVFFFELSTDLMKESKKSPGFTVNQLISCNRKSIGNKKLMASIYIQQKQPARAESLFLENLQLANELFEKTNQHIEHYGDVIFALANLETFYRMRNQLQSAVNYKQRYKNIILTMYNKGLTISKAIQELYNKS